MNLTSNYTTGSKHAGILDWGRGYMYRQKGWARKGWQEGTYGSDVLFRQYMLWGSKYGS